ncbi:MAG: 3-hydroxylacyl-ACP dehydratase [Treponema sp.]|nr:3-hydroxylacyl-ACP dehydratase [Spirochaetia bacterium]MDD7460480.1 3-hydroxylacyl-ACP dehydratase [Spirochaetales bacterium]MDY5812026.1 3-hydroxylacyl-ACP dehydratase [Treponema sp.]MEE1181317.1 3-hydroxylacyl-ACP dehydratase [Treponema sp.]
MNQLNRLIEKDKLINYVPHKGKMFLLSRVTDYDVENYTITAETDVTKDFIFYEEELGGIPSWCTFEIMAQAISALTGIHDSVYKIEPKAGCILSVTGFSAKKENFSCGTTLKVTAAEEYRDEESGIYRYSCKTFSSPESQEADVEVTLTVMQAENLESIINR